MATLHLGDCREVLATIPDCSIDAIVTDPPYELGFMGKSWDNTGISYDVRVWSECLRVLKPGGHVLAFGGSRTYHRMAVAIEDAGFEIRDCIMWIYGTGFPKSLAVDKAFDKRRNDRAQVYAVTAWMRQARDNAGLSNADIDKAFGLNGMAGHWTSSASQPSVPTLDQIPPLLALFGMTLDDVPDDIRTLIWTLNGRRGQPGEAWFQREVVTEKREDMFGEYEVEDVRTMVDSKKARPGMPLQQNANHQVAITAPATDLAKQWQGWGTALKPAHEPIVVARKPLTGTVADNVMQWGVGALNIDGCRINGAPWHKNDNGIGNPGMWAGKKQRHYAESHTAGRWPANVILDEDAVNTLDAQSDGASRFFYVAKASKAEREAGLGQCDGRANHHPTVKPIALMRYLVRLVTPKGGIVLDPFTGSGTTGCAAVLEGMHFVGIEQSAEYIAIADARIAHHGAQTTLDL